MQRLHKALRDLANGGPLVLVAEADSQGSPELRSSPLCTSVSLVQSTDTNASKGRCKAAKR